MTIRTPMQHKMPASLSASLSTTGKTVDHSGEPEWMREARTAPLNTFGKGTIHSIQSGVRISGRPAAE